MLKAAGQVVHGEFPKIPLTVPGVHPRQTPVAASKLVPGAQPRSQDVCSGSMFWQDLMSDCGVWEIKLINSVCVIDRLNMRNSSMVILKSLPPI